jgi:predicted PurR-regulated permease PerM
MRAVAAARTPAKKAGTRKPAATKRVKAVKRPTQPRRSTPAEKASTRGFAEVPRWVRKTIALFFVWAVGLFIAAWALDRLRPLLFMFVIAFFLSLAIEPAVNRLAKRGWRRGGATGLVVGGVLVGTVAFFAAFGSVAFSQASELIDDTPKYVRNVVNTLNDDFGFNIDARELIKDLESEDGAVRELGRDLADSAPEIGLAIAEGLFQILVIFVFSFYLTADGPKLRRTICARLPPERQEIVLDTWELAIDKTGAYLYWRGTQAAISIVVTWAFLFALGVPSALALAIFVGVVSQFVPTIGTYIAMVLPFVVALLNSPIDALWVLVFLNVYQQFENYVLGPRLARFTLKIHPALTIGTVLAGGMLFGLAGALLALPATAVIQALLSTYTEEQEVIESDLTKEQRKRRKRRFRVPRFSLRRSGENATR